MVQTTRLGHRRAVINNKGGVGKTALVVELAAALARRGRTVLAVDLDPQANLTRRLAAVGDADLADALRAPARGAAGQARTCCGWSAAEGESIDVLPSSFGLEDRVLEAGIPGAARRLRKALYEITDEYDYTLIDCPPSMGHLTQMAIAALDGPDDAVLLPVVPEHDAIAGAIRAVGLIDQWAEDLIGPGQQLDIAGAIVNGVRSRVSLHSVRLEDLPHQLIRGADEELAEPIKIDVWEPHIPLAARLAELHDAGRPSSADRGLVREGIVDRFDALAQRLDRHPPATADTAGYAGTEAG